MIKVLKWQLAFILLIYITIIIKIFKGQLILIIYNEKESKKEAGSECYRITVASKGKGS